MFTLRRSIARDETGATAIEYAFLLAFVALAIIGGATQLGVSLDGVFTTVSGPLGP